MNLDESSMRFGCESIGFTRALGARAHELNLVALHGGVGERLFELERDIVAMGRSHWAEYQVFAAIAARSMPSGVIADSEEEHAMKLLDQ